MQQDLFSQKIGVVLSGGGGSGLAHVGVLKALEENNIPIDYIAGTSIGALVGGLYAAGYSPQQIEQIVTSKDVQRWAKGNPSKDLLYYIKQNEHTPSIISLKFDIDSFETNIPTSFVNSAPLDLGLMEGFAPAQAAAGGNFDSLMIPFRCVAANISRRKAHIFEEGNLATAIRASMAYPLYLSPVKIGKDLMFDGGLYNNFPVDILCEEFQPDFIIGSNVSSNFAPPQEDNLLSQIRSMLSKDTEYNISCGEGIIIHPKVNDIGVFDFRSSQQAVDSGYSKTMEMLDSIKKMVDLSEREVHTNKKRKEFKEKWVPLEFENTKVIGLHPRQTKFLIQGVRNNNGTFTQRSVQEIYMKLISDQKIKNIYPTATYNQKNENFDLKLDIEKEKSFTASFGGVISSKPINTGFFQLQYQTLGATGLSVTGNTYFGKLYSSASAKARWDIPFSLPFYLKANFTINHFDYFNSFSTFVEEIRPSYLIISETFEEMSINLPVFLKGKIEAGGTNFKQEYEYYQTKDFERNDTADITSFDGVSAFLKYERNSLNRKQYASSGSRFALTYRYTIGDEKTIPGSTAAFDRTFFKEHDWLTLKISYEKYFLRNHKFKMGGLLEATYTDQTFFNNYTATVLAAPSFLPLPESKTLFQNQYRAMQYFAGGLKTIFSVNEKFDLRLEGYVFQPYEELQETSLQRASPGTEISVRDFIGSFSSVYHTQLGPIALSVNYYENTEDPFSALIHFGYILFNKRALE